MSSKCRGKRIDTGEWMYGEKLTIGSKIFIVPSGASISITADYNTCNGTAYGFGEISHSHEGSGSCWPTEVHPASVGMFTGLKDAGLWPNSEFDKDGNALGLKEIYTHDIVEVVSNNVVADGYAYERSGQRPNGERFVVSVTEAGFTLIPVDWFDLSKEPFSPNRMGFVNNYNLWNGTRSLKVIGNIHQHPALLENKPC